MKCQRCFSRIVPRPDTNLTLTLEGGFNAIEMNLWSSSRFRYLSLRVRSKLEYPLGLVHTDKKRIEGPISKLLLGFTEVAWTSIKISSAFENPGVGRVARSYPPQLAIY